MVYFLGLGEGMAGPIAICNSQRPSSFIAGRSFDERSIIRSLSASSRSIPTLANSEWGTRFCFLCKMPTHARRISDRRSATTLLPPGYRASSRTSSAATSSFCPLATTRSASSGSARCSFKASGAGADIHISISSGLVRMTGMAFA